MPLTQLLRQVKHTPRPQQLVTCTVEGGEGRNKLRRATVQLPNTATFGELLELARKKRYGALEFEGPVYGCSGELETTLRDTWARNGCKIDGTLHIGLAVVVSFPTGGQKPLSLIMGPGDTVNKVKQVGFERCLLGVPQQLLFYVSHVGWYLQVSSIQMLRHCGGFQADFAEVSSKHRSYFEVSYTLCFAVSAEGLR